VAAGRIGCSKSWRHTLVLSDGYVFTETMVSGSLSAL